MAGCAKLQLVASSSYVLHTVDQVAAAILTRYIVIIPEPMAYA